MEEAVSKTFTNRDRNFGVVQFDLLMDLSSDFSMQKKWAAFLRKIKTSEAVFPEVLAALQAFLRDIIVAVESDEPFVKTWNSVDGQWK